MMRRIAKVGVVLLLLASPVGTQTLGKSDDHRNPNLDANKLGEWLRDWERTILRDDATQYCSAEAGEELGWKMSPFLKGFYNGYLATGSSMWVDRLVACTDAWLKRAVREPDGYLGWPKLGAAGTEVDNLDSFYADSIVGEAMALTPVVLMAAVIRETPSLAGQYGSKAEVYLDLAEDIFKKWDSRGAWRETQAGTAITVELPFGINETTGKWTGEYEKRKSLEFGFSHPDNKANLVAAWLLAMFDATGKTIYVKLAEHWFETMKSRMKRASDGTYEIWNYWEPAGSWDYRSYIIPKHWIGIHPNPGYYDIDVAAIVAAYEHHVVFNEEDINRLIETAIRDERYWTALVPFDETVQQHFERSLHPASWTALIQVPWYAAIQRNSAHKPMKSRVSVRPVL